MLHKNYYIEAEKQRKLIERKNQKTDFYNGIYDRYENPVLTRDFVPLTWRYDLNPATNPDFMERLGINAVMNSGAIKLNGKYLLVVRVEGNDRKSFFAVAESDNGIDGFHFWDYPVVLPDTCPEETNVYDMRLTQHEDGWIYGVFCSESKDKSDPDLSAAVAEAGIVRTKDLKTWERLDNLKTLRSPQQRNVVLHPEFVDGKYAFYTRPMDGFIETGSGGGIGFGLCGDICHAVIDEEKIISRRVYHTLTEAKNGAGAVPIRGKKCWINIAHGVRNTAAGLRYVLYAFATDLKDPSNMDQEVSEEPASENTEASAEEETKEKAPEKEGFFKKKKDPKDEKIEELTDRVKRQMAEFDNFRKRTEKEKSTMYEMGAKDIIERMLPVIDNFERGLASIPESEKNTAFAEGMEKIYKQFQKVLEDAGVKAIEAAGQPFDPNFHNAVMHVEDENFGENIVAEELQKGYMYRDSVVRHSMVKVAN